MKKFFSWLKDEESGQGMVEYGLIIALIAVVLIVALTAMGGGLTNIFGKITAELNK
jgi:pilus assembly protein Flp/PilA